MKIPRPSIKQLVIVLCIVLLVVLYLSAPRRSRTVIRLHDDQVEIQKLNNAIAEFIIKEGYGYRVELIESTIKEVREQLLRGDIDITLELWVENNLLWYQTGMQDGLIDDLGPIYSGGKQYWIVSSWYAKEQGIRTVLDMIKHWHDFLDPEDPSKGLFLNCIVGWHCREINRVKLKAYGLDRHFNTVSPVSPESLRSIYENAQQRSLPVFGYYWEPNTIMTSQDWHILEEPAYSEEIWKKIITAASKPSSPPPQEACAFNDSGVNKIANSGLHKKAPDVTAMLKKMKIDSSLFNTILLNNEIPLTGTSRPQTQARFFLLNYPDQWANWVPPEIKSKIETALNRTSTKPTGR